MWAVFEWENKVAVNTTLTDLHDYLEHLLKVNTLETRSKKSLIPSSQQKFQDPICWFEDCSSQDFRISNLRISEYQDLKSQDQIHFDPFWSTNIHSQVPDLRSISYLIWTPFYPPHTPISILKALQLRCELKIQSNRIRIKRGSQSCNWKRPKSTFFTLAGWRRSSAFP